MTSSVSPQMKSDEEFVKIEVEEIGKKELDTNQILENKEYVSKPLDHISQHESVGGFKTPEPIEKPAQDKAEIDTVINVLKADPQENGDVNDVRCETLIQDNDVAVTCNATMGNDSTVVGTDEDMQLSPTGSAENLQISPRMHVPHIRARDSSSSAELDGANKRQKIKVCKFYARGWCMKGVLCRFPHVNEGSNATVKKSEDESAVTCHWKVTVPSSAHISAASSVRPEQPSSSYLPSWNTNNYGGHKPFDSILMCRPSISSSVQAVSPVLYRQSGNNLQTPIFKDPNDYMSKTAFNWEPSVPFRPSHPITVKLLSEANLYDPQCDSIAQAKVDELRIDNETDVDFQERKACEGYKETDLKPIQAAIIKHVKELIRPTWQKGFMSKDAYILIIKKSVDKVIRSFENELVPFTPQQITSYLSRSRSKLEKLVEAYVEKHHRKP